MRPSTTLTPLEQARQTLAERREALQPYDMRIWHERQELARLRALPMPTDYDAVQAREEQIKRQAFAIEQLEREQMSLKQPVYDAEAQVRAEENRLERARADLTSARHRVTGAQAQVARYEQVLTQARQELAQAEAALPRLEQQLAELEPEDQAVGQAA
jgi:chromosome segregation ATPase